MNENEEAARGSRHATEEEKARKFEEERQQRIQKFKKEKMEQEKKDRKFREKLKHQQIEKAKKKMATNPLNVDQVKLYEESLSRVYGKSRNESMKPTS